MFKVQKCKCAVCTTGVPIVLQSLRGWCCLFPFRIFRKARSLRDLRDLRLVVVQRVQLHGLHGLHKGLNGKRQRSCAMCANTPLRGVALCTLCTTVVCCLMARVFGLI